MSAGLVAITVVIYAYVALEQALKGETAMALVYVGYALANIGLFWAVK